MKIDVKLREELAQKLYEESDRTGVAWVRRPESVKHAFREAAERKLRNFIPKTIWVIITTGMGTVIAMPTTTSERTRNTVGTHRPAEAGHTKSNPVMEPRTR